MKTTDEILTTLRANANPANVEGMARFGINSHNTLGVSVAFLRGLAKQIGRDHETAVALWDSGLHEARILASIVGDPKQVTEEQMERWALDLDSWDVCDGLCNNLFRKTPFAWQKALEWPHREEEFVRRAGFVLMAVLAVHDKKAPDDRFMQLFPLMVQYATDQRNFVKKAVNWALRETGKRNAALLEAATQTAETMKQIPSPTARWIAADALREFAKRKQP